MPTFLAQMKSGRQALLTHIDAVRDAQINELLERARRESADLIAGSRRQTGERVRAAVREERQQRAQVRQHARGDLQAAVSELQHQHIHAVLEQAVALLQKVLAEMWLDARIRRHWFDLVSTTAIQRLIDNKWIIEHPQDWDPRELADTLPVLIERHGIVDLKFRACAEMTAGFRVSSHDVAIDGSLAALLENRGSVDGELLGALMRLPGWPSDQLPPDMGTR